MKNFLLLIVVIAYGCKSSNTQKITCDFEKISIKNEFQSTTVQNNINEKLLGKKNEQFIIKTKDFSVTFLEVKSTDNNPSGDFRVKHKGDSIFIFRNFLESDNLFSKKFQINSDLVDSLQVKANYHNDYLFTGEEKKVSLLNLNTINTGLLSRDNKNLFYPHSIINDELKNSYKVLEVLKRAKCINRQYYSKIIESESYGDNDRKNAKKQIKILENTENLNALFIEYDNLKVILDVKYYISGKSHFKTLIIVSNDIE